MTVSVVLEHAPFRHCSVGSARDLRHGWRRVGFVLRVLSFAEHDLALAFAATAVEILSEADWVLAD